jgi:hypothetical protein
MPSSISRANDSESLAAAVAGRGASVGAGGATSGCPGPGNSGWSLPVGAFNVGGGRNPGTPGAAGATVAASCSGGLVGATAGVMGRVAVMGGAAATVGAIGDGATGGVIGCVPVMGRVLVLVAVRVTVGVSGGDWKTGRAKASPGIIQVTVIDKATRTSMAIGRRMKTVGLKCKTGSSWAQDALLCKALAVRGANL